MAKASAKQMAWRKKFAELYGNKKKKQSKGGTHTAKKKKNGNGGKRQGVISWVTNLITFAMALAPVGYRIAWSKFAAPGQRWNAFASSLINDYTGFNPVMGAYGDNSFNIKRAVQGWAPLAGAYAFKTAMTLIQKKAPIKSLIPRLG